MLYFNLFLLVTSSVKFSGTLGNNITKKKKEKKGHFIKVSMYLA